MPSVVSRAWMVSIANPKIPCDAYLNQWLADGNIVFGCGQYEKGEGGLLHHQIYIVTKKNEKNKNGFTLKWLKENVHTSAHFEKRFGSHDQAVAYCTKEDTRLAGPWTVGEWDERHQLTMQERAKGTSKSNETNKRKFADFHQLIRGGATDLELIEEFPQLYMSMTKGVEKARLIYAQSHPRIQPYVLVLWGATGTGKSHRANEIMAANGGGFVFRKGNSGNMWADGYDPMRHPVVIFDEMDGAFMPYRQLLRVCDKWPLVLDTKGGAINFTPKIIIFTAHKHPKEWYSIEAVPDTTEMMRRFSGTYGTIVHMTTPYQETDNDQPDLADVLDLLETGELVDNMRVAIEQEQQEEEEEEGGDSGENGVVDLTASMELFLDLCCCDFCGKNVREGCSCCTDEDSSGACFHDDGYVCEACAPPIVQPLSPPLSQAQKLRRTDSEQREWVLKQETPRPGVYKPTGPGATQTRLSFKPAPSSARRLLSGNDDDDDVDDK